MPRTLVLTCDFTIKQARLVEIGQRKRTRYVTSLSLFKMASHKENYQCGNIAEEDKDYDNFMNDFTEITLKYKLSGSYGPKCGV